MGHWEQRTAWTAAVGAILALLFAAPAMAEAPEITSGPTVVGTPQVGETLRGEATWEGDGVTWQWYTCRGPQSLQCAEIAGADEQTYVVPEEEQDNRLRVGLDVWTYDGEHTWDWSKPTSPIRPRPEPTPTPDPTPTPTPDPTPTPTPTVTPDDPDPTAEPTPVAEITPGPLLTGTPAPTPDLAVGDPIVDPLSPLLLSPFPLVRFRGYLTTTGARLTLLTVKAPAGVRIAVRCYGLSCPRKKLARLTRVTRLSAFERPLRAGTRIVVKVTRAGWIGKHSVIVIRKGKAPKRRDRCLFPGAPEPRRCPLP